MHFAHHATMQPQLRHGFNVIGMVEEGAPGVGDKDLIEVVGELRRSLEKGVLIADLALCAATRGGQGRSARHPP
ncbi:MAG: hypothetical protein GEV09_12870 [Pseudonocardiaceae bacterium]|nr:hypothetical protein [Pseudonocardiaceae bacterium]